MATRSFGRPLTLDIPPAGDVAQVLLLRRCKRVAARAVGDEIQIARLRRITDLSAQGASKSHGRLNTFYEGLKARGKPPKAALIALGRKLLCTGLAVVKSGTPYQDDYVRVDHRPEPPAAPTVLSG